MKADAATEAAVRAVMQAFADCQARQDVEGLMALHAPDADLLIFDVSAKKEGPEGVRALLEDNFARYGAISFAYDWATVSAAGPVAWVSSEVTVKSQEEGEWRVIGQARLTIVLEQRDSKWLIVHGHESVALSE
jgi:uncharacterized protein (TIGR02246 family)